MTLESTPADGVGHDALVRAALDTFTSHALIVTDRRGVISSWSGGAQHLFGIPSEHAVGQPLAACVADAADAIPGCGDVAWLEREADGQPRGHLFYHDGSMRACVAQVTRVGAPEGAVAFAILTTAHQAERPGPAARVDESLAAKTFDRTEADAARLRLLQRLVVAEEEERRRIALNLHDDLGQQLTSLRLSLEALRMKVDAQPALARTADSALAILVTIDEGLDFLAWELSPAGLEELGLAKVIESYVTEWSRHSSIPARFHSGLRDDERFAPEVEATLYRIAQEALNNVAKHSHADSVNVRLEARGHRLVLTVEDDGIGWGGREATDRTMGLSGMRERALAVGGRLELEATPRGGTTVLAHIPMVLMPRPTAPPWSSAAVAHAEAASAGPTPTDAVLGALQARLLELQKAVGARDEFIATVAHELRNPISPLVFQLRLALDKTEQMLASGESPTVGWIQAQLRRMEQRLNRLLETLDRLLDVSRLASGRIDLQTESLDLSRVAQDVLSGFEAELAVARCPVSFLTSGETSGRWDRMRLEQICRNLLSNAIRFGAGQPIDVVVNGDAETVTLQVRDRGVGIAPGLHARIFERFERGVEPRSGGFGIGLWVVRNICVAMGGGIAVESNLGEGACFTVTLPRRLDPRPAATHEYR